MKNFQGYSEEDGRNSPLETCLE